MLWNGLEKIVLELKEREKERSTQTKIQRHVEKQKRKIYRRNIVPLLPLSLFFVSFSLSLALT
jgi:hypothetical protein